MASITEILNSKTKHDNVRVKNITAALAYRGFYPYTQWAQLAPVKNRGEWNFFLMRFSTELYHKMMLDDWFSSLMILVSEKDVVDKLSVDNIIDSFAGSSAPLQKLLLQNYAQN